VVWGPLKIEVLSETVGPHIPLVRCHVYFFYYFF